MPSSKVTSGEIQMSFDNKQPDEQPIAESTSNLAIQTNGLTRYFDDFCAVNGVDLQVEKGTFYGFLGPNGAGKSTTIKMLTGLLAPSAGHVRILDGNPLVESEAIEIKRRIGVVPENLALFENLRAREYLTFVGRMYNMEESTLKSRIDELLLLMKLHEAEKKIALEYSHGMQKKLALAAALLPNPDLLFLDEPFEGVDAVAAKTLRDTLGKFCVSRLDGFPDIPRLGNCRKTLHACGDYCERATCRAILTCRNPRRTRSVPRRSLHRNCWGRGRHPRPAQLARIIGGDVELATI